ncbi:MAG: hypothetical protein K5925_04780 [Bacilli bacterium]|nr:hypothetical protein [Bacilli bacterium]
MRRLWAHIIIAFTCVVTAFAAFPALLKGIQTNGDYKARRQFTYQLTEKKVLEGDPVALKDDSASVVAKIMEERLVQAGVSSYEVAVAGNDTIKVTFVADNETQYSQITTYLGFSGSFALMNKDPDGEPLVAKDFLNGSAYLKQANVNEYPALIIPVKTDSEAYKSMIKWAQDNPEDVESSEEEDSSESEEKKQTAPLYLIYNYVEGDTYKTLTDSNRFNEKILLTFNALTEDTLYYDSDHNSFCQVIGYSDSNSNGYADASEVKAAYDQANFLYNLFSSSAYDYDVEVIRGLADGTQVYVNAKVESIFSYSKIAWTSTLTAIVAAIIIVSLLLVVFYRLGALSIATTTIVSSILSFLFVILTGMEYNTLALVGLVTIAILSLISGVIYLNKFKEECYRGRTLKKANSEAARKSTLPIVDVHVVAVVVGLFCYLLGGTALHSFSAILLLGSLASVLLNIFGLRGMMWLATNTTALTGKYEIFAVESDKVPDHMTEEKQKYFGAYADRDLTKSKKPIMIGALVLFIAAVVGISVNGALHNGNIFNPPAEQVTTSEIYVEDTVKVLSDEKSSMTEDAIRTMFGNIKLCEKGESSQVKWDDTDTHPTLLSYVSKINTFETSDSETIEGTTTSYSNKYFAISLNKVLDGEKNYAVAKDYATTDEFTLNALLNNYFTDINTDYSSSVKTTASLKAVTTLNNLPSADWKWISISTAIAIGVITIYMLIRYRLSRGLASIIYPATASAITLGLFMLLNVIGLNLPATVAILIPLSTIFAYTFIIFIANKEREMIVDERSKDNSYEHRQELSIRALGIAFTPVLATSILGIYMLINFFGFGPSVNSYIYVASLIGVLVALLLVTTTFIPVSNFLFKQFSKISFEPRVKKNKKTNQIKQKSNEPEEAIFIGIND